MSRQAPKGVHVRCNVPSKYPHAAALGGTCGWQNRSATWQEAHAEFAEHVRTTHPGWRP